MLNRRKFLQKTSGVMAANLVQLPSSEAAGAADAERPNFLIFMPDQHQGQAILPGYPTIMPNLRRFESQGVTFTRAFCPAPHCCPSRATFMTGLYPSEHGVFNNVDTDTAIHANPYPSVKFFSEALHAAGYHLAYSGKWHVARDIWPEDRGWTNLTPHQEDYIPGADLKDSKWARARAELAEDKPRAQGEIQRPGWQNVQLYRTYAPRGPLGFEGMPDYEVVRIGVDWLHKLTRSVRPWCLMVSNEGGHDTYDVPQNFAAMYHPESVELPPNFRDTLEDKPRIYQRMRYQYWSQLSDDEVRQGIAHYWAKLTMQDVMFGLLLDALEKSGQADNTIVIYTSDHGDYAGAHGLWCKGVPGFREAYNIPCVVRWPRGIGRAGRQVDAFVSTADFAPTILDAAGVLPGFHMSGSSLLPWLRGDTPSDWRDAIFAQLNGVELYYSQRIVMTDSYKYVYNGFDFDELYDLKNDPHEMVNLAFPDVTQARARMLTGKGLHDSHELPWPPLPQPLAGVRRELLQRMWKFAQEHRDQVLDRYYTVAMAPYGPAIAV